MTTQTHAFSDLPDDCVWEVTRRLVSPYDYYALARCSRELWALLTRADYAKPMTDTYFHSWRDLHRPCPGLTFEELMADASTVWTHDLCLALVEMKGSLLKYMRLPLEEAFNDDEMKTFINNNASRAWYDLMEIVDQMEALANGPNRLFRGRTDNDEYVCIKQTLELCLAAVKQNGLALRHVQIIQTRDLCLAAVTQNGLALEFIYLKTYAICLAAVHQTPEALRYVPRRHRTIDICVAAVRQNGLALKHVPPELQTIDICVAAVAQTRGALMYVERERTPEFLLAVVQLDGFLIKELTAAEQTLELEMAAVQQNGLVLQLIKRKTFKLCMAAVTQNGLALEFVPIRFPDICSAAVAQNPQALKYTHTGSPPPGAHNTAPPGE